MTTPPSAPESLLEEHDTTTLKLIKNASNFVRRAASTSVDFRLKSPAFPFRHSLDKFEEIRPRVPWAWRSFWVILNAACVFAANPNSLNSFIVKIQLSHHCAGSVEAAGIDGISVVLARNRYSSGFQIFNWMVRSTMAKFKLEGLPSNRMTKQLVTKTNAKDRSLSD
jgi:hypothetical protein